MSLLFTDVLVYDRSAPAGFVGPTDVLVEGNAIVAIGPRLREFGLSASGQTNALGTEVRARAEGADRVIRGDGHRLLLPGLVNAHFHSPANHLRGSVRSLPLELFMLQESPADPSLTPTPHEAYVRTMLAAVEMLQRGITSVQDDAFLMPTPEPEIIDAVAQAYEDSGIRATLALDQPELPEKDKLPFISDDAPELTDYLAQGPAAGADELLAAYDHLISRWHQKADGRIRAAVSVSAPQRVSPAYFASLQQLAEQHDLAVYAHMLETRTQAALTQHPRFHGLSLVAYTDELGLLTERTNVIHAVWVSDDDLDRIAAAKSTIAHNPVSNLRLGSGVMPWRDVLDRGITVALGTDEAICDDTVNIWTVAKTAGLIHNVSGRDPHDWPAAHEVLDALWLGGARAQRLAGKVGSVEVGMLADLTLVELHSLPFTPLNDLREQLVYAEDGRDVVLTAVDGRVVAENGHVTTVDEDALLAEARAIFTAKQPALEAARERAAVVEPAYRAMVHKAARLDVGVHRWVGVQ